MRGTQGTAGVTVSDTGKLIYSDNEGLAVYYTGAEARSEGGKYLYKIVLEAKNQTGKDVVIIPTSISLDGEDVEADLIDYSNGSITFYTNSYRTEGATVEFDLTIEYKQDGDTVIDEDAARVTINVKEEDVEDTKAEEEEKKKKEEEDLIMSGDDILFY